MTGLVVLGYATSDQVDAKIQLLYQCFLDPGTQKLTPVRFRLCLDLCLNICYQTTKPSLLPKLKTTHREPDHYSFEEFKKALEAVHVISVHIWSHSATDEESFEDEDHDDGDADQDEDCLLP